MYAELTLKDQMTPALNTAKGSLTGFSGQTLKTIGSIVGITSAVAIAGMAFQKFTGFVKDSVLIAARVEEMNAVLYTLGRTAGMTSEEIDKQVKSVKSMGITTGVAQTVVAQFIRYQLNMAQSTDLARVAQDAAVISMQDSSQALDGLIYGITTFNPKILRTYGIVVDSNTVFGEYAATLGKSADELSGAEKQQAYLNAVIKSGTQIAGAYDAAMGTAGKQLRSYDRVVKELQEKIGNDLLPAFTDFIFELTEATKWVTANYEEIKVWIEVVSWFTGIGIAAHVREFTNELIGNATAGKDVTWQTKKFGSSVFDLGVSVDDLSDAMPVVIEHFDLSADAEGKAAYQAGLLASGIGEVSDQMRDATGGLIAYKDQLDTVIDGAKMLDDQQKNLKDSVDKMKEAERAYVQYKKDHPFDLEGIQAMRDKWIDLAGDVKDVQDANELQTKKWVANLLLQQLSLGEEGLSGAEMKYYLQYMEHNGLITEESADLAQAMWDDTIKMAEGMGGVTDAADDVTGAIGNIPKDTDVRLNPHGFRETEGQAIDVKLAIFGIPPSTDVKVNPHGIRDAETQAHDLQGAIGNIPKSTGVATSTSGFTQGITEAHNLRDAINDIPKYTKIIVEYEERGKGGGYAGGGSFTGWGMVGDSPGGGITPYTEWVYAPQGATVFNQAQMAGKGIPSFAGGGEIPPASQSSEVNLSGRSIRELADALFYKLQAVI